MSVPTNYDTRPYTPPDARWLFPDAHPNKPAASEPGLIVAAAGAIAIRSSLFRPYDNQFGDAPQIQDTISLINSVAGLPHRETPCRLIGLEGEMFVLHAITGEAVPVYNVGVEEFQRSQIEANSEAFEQPYAAVESLQDEQRFINDALAVNVGQFAAIDPASALMHRLPTEADVRDNNPYMARVAELLPKSVEFIGSGVHMHVDVAAERAPLVANYLRLIVPYMNLPLQSAPFAFGDPHPRMGEVYDFEPSKPYDGQPMQSGRYVSRVARLENGGVGIKLAHDTMEGALRHSEQRLLTGEVNHPARLYGSHADVRIRYDAVSDDKKDGMARIEVCVFDTGAYRAESLIAVAELLKAVTWRIESAVSIGEQGIDQLHRTHSDLFGTRPGIDTIANNLYRTEENSLAMAYDGFDASVQDYTGKTRTARNLFWRVYDFGAKKAPLNVAVFQKAAMNKATLDYHILQSGLPTLRGYYDTGYGTPSDWIRAHYEAISQSEAKDDYWRLAAHDRIKSLRYHLCRTAISDVVR